MNEAMDAANEAGEGDEEGIDTLSIAYLNALESGILARQGALQMPCTMPRNLR